jgi:hypothetical protein
LIDHKATTGALVMPRRFGTKRLLAALLVLVMALVVLATRFIGGKPRVLPTISKETTYITEPLRSDGWPDYVAALNQRASKGVTPENNAVVLLWKAMGPREIDAKCRERYFRSLGMAPLPEQGDYFLDLDTFIARREAARKPAETIPAVDAVWDQLWLAMKRPWSKREFPLLAEWLAANEKPFALLLEASNRPRFYDPVVCGDKGSLSDAPLSGFQRCRRVSQAILARAMLRLGDGKVDEAWADLVTCHRFAKLLADDSATVIQAIIAETVMIAVCAGDQALLQHVNLTASQIEKMRRDLAKLTPEPKLAEIMGVGERFLILEWVAITAREGPLAKSALGDAVESLLIAVGRPTVKWDVVLRTCNQWYDRVADAGRRATLAEQKRAFDNIFDCDLGTEVAAASNGTSVRAARSAGRRDVSRQIGVILITLDLHTIMVAENAAFRPAMQFKLTKLAFTLAAYRADHGAYPARLAALVPKYVAAVPKDVFDNDADLHYAREGDGYLLYSVGINGKDDGGKDYDDRKSGEDWDDLVVRMPAAAKPSEGTN